MTGRVFNGLLDVTDHYLIAPASVFGVISSVATIFLVCNLLPLFSILQTRVRINLRNVVGGIMDAYRR